MPVLEHLSEKIRKNESIPAPVAALLSAATPFVRAGMILRRARRKVHVDARVISFGNITAGGTGKTPAVIERVRREISAGAKVAVLTRGYGSRSGKACVVADETTPPHALFNLIGDEPALILRKAAGAIVVKNANRVDGARIAISRGCDTLVLDDGFQYVRLDRDEDVVLIDATNPFGNSRLIPRGILREPIAAVARATHIIVTRCDQAGDLSNVLDRIRQFAPNAPIRLTRHAPRDLWRVCDGMTLSLAELKGMRVHAVTGTGNPEAFYRTLESLGAFLATKRTYPDHAMIPCDAFDTDVPVIVTEKDAMRVPEPPPQVYALPIELEDFVP